jgi:hypothetical protein
MDAISITQTQIAAQLDAIKAAMQASTISGTIKSNLISSAATLQQLLDKLILGQTLSSADQQVLTDSLNTSQKAMLAAQARRTQMIILGLAGIVVLGMTIFLLVRHSKKRNTYD